MTFEWEPFVSGMVGGTIGFWMVRRKTLRALGGLLREGRRRLSKRRVSR